MNDSSPFVLLILQATPFCNLDCTYCYLPDRTDRGRFDLTLIPSIMDNLERSNLLNNELNVQWHAGEPTVLPPSFYKTAFKLFEKHNLNEVKIAHSFQTNATLLTQEYCDFIKEYNVSIGVSIDGCDFIHNRNRTYRNGKGSFSQTMKGIELLKKNDIDFSIIAVLTDFSLQYPDELYVFFRDLGVKSVGFNVEEKEGCHTKSSMDYKMQEKYRNFLNQFIKSIREGDFKLYQREYNKILNSILYRSDNFKNGLVTPLSTITVDIKGNFTAFSPELLTLKDRLHGNYIFGNVNTILFSEIFHDPHFVNIYSEIVKGVEMCKATCEYFSICGGGAPSSKINENGTFASTETNYCVYNIKIPTDIILKDLESCN